MIFSIYEFDMPYLDLSWGSAQVGAAATHDFAAGYDDTVPDIFNITGSMDDLEYIYF
jgi:hypothetical protein